MAASDAKPFPLKGAAYRLYFELRDTSNNFLTAAITGADSRIKGDGVAGAHAPTTNAVQQVGTGTNTKGLCFVDLTTSEMTFDHVHYTFVCTNANVPPVSVHLFPMEEDDTDVWALRKMKRDWTGIAGEASFSELNAMRFLRNDWAVNASNVLTVKKENGSTDAFDKQLGTSASALPVISSTEIP